MGIPRGSARLLIEEAKSRPFSGSVLQLGRSSVYFGWRDLERWAGKHRFALRAVEPAPSHDPRLAAQGCIADATLFRALGFDEVRSCDVEAWEGADYLFDLNGEVPAELHGRFDVVFETGTIVQVFDLPRVLHNLHRLLRAGGRVIHCAVPSNNHMDLGFYMLSPTFFADYYQANGYRIETQYLCEYFAWWLDGRLYSDRWRGLGLRARPARSPELRTLRRRTGRDLSGGDQARDEHRRRQPSARPVPRRVEGLPRRLRRWRRRRGRERCAQGRRARIGPRACTREEHHRTAHCSRAQACRRVCTAHAAEGPAPAKDAGVTGGKAGQQAAQSAPHRISRASTSSLCLPYADCRVLTAFP